MRSTLHASRAIVRAICFFVIALLLSSIQATAQGTLRGTVKDPLGAIVVHAKVELLSGATVAATTTTGQAGEYVLPVKTAGIYRVRATAPTFQTSISQPIFSTPFINSNIDITLATGTLTQQITVTTGTPTPIAQVGAPVTVLTSDSFRYTPQVADPLRLVPGLQLTQSGQAGGTTALYIRGGNSNANKVLIDGVPANDIGGAVEFANLATVGVDQIEVLRQPNSTLYGSDALAGVVSLTTARGTTGLPLFTYAGDAGNFGTYSQAVSASGLFRQFDYLSEFSRMDTRNNLPRDQFHNATYVGNFGWTPNTDNNLRFTVRHLAVAAGQPNTIQLYGIADAAGYKEQENYYSAIWNNQTTNRWHNQIRYGGLRLNYQYTDYAPTGIYDPNTDLYLGKPLTITGANGYSVTGQAIFQYGASYGSSYPSVYKAPSKRDFVYAQTDYQFSPRLVALGGFKYEDERGYTLSEGSTPNSIERGNYSYTLQLGGALGDRLYYTLGSGLEDNGLFGFAATPRASLAYYLARPSAAHWLSGTKLHFSFGKGIKEPNISDQDSSLYDLLASQPNGSSLISQYHVSPIGPETSRSYDGGLDQQLWNGRARIGVTYFHNEFTNGVEYVPQSALLELGIPAGSDPATQFGATINSMAFRARGAEAEGEYQVSHHLFARGGYTYLDAAVQRSFSSESAPAYNTSSDFSTIPIGQYSPLIGARPFRRAPHTGYFSLNYMRSRWYGSLTGTLVGRRDDSTYLSDENFGYSLLLPNHNLLGAYQRLDLSGSYEVSHAVTAYANIQNLLSEHYSEAFGYPALPFTFRTGLKVSFGGESWSIR
ncbi:TonB-dependent receptor [Edaphobacter acidisoli]|uniref:TonB-dependent receptor n=1 Tax=Edaphobacter acidisoli TaxID=2040573 RepID=A0A916RW38_9BACT|nr:TonB-dependent receptor [Edaphobacter acidisoli]GGA73640.1 TonB-dependent receptor [Edaphobacter acidisoli]